MKDKILLITLILLSLVPLFGWFHPGLPVTHDGQDHVARIANFYQSLQDGIIVPRWAKNLNWGYGHPILMFLYPLPSYMGSLFHFFGFSFVDSTKLVFIVSFILSGITMYIWLRELLSKQAAFIGSLVYLFAPYRFIDLYVRGAIGEHVAFVFPPLILFFLLRLTKSLRTDKKMEKRTLLTLFSTTRKDIILGSLSLAGLILAHNAISLMFLPLLAVYVLFLLFQTKYKKYFIASVVAIGIFGFLVSAFFWLPAFFEGKYTLRDIVTQGTFASGFSSWQQFIYGTWSYGGSGQLSVQVGIIQWLSVIAAIPLTVILYKKKSKHWILTLSALLIFFLTLFLMNSSSKILWDKVTIIQKFQFPWRFLSVTVFMTAVLAALVSSHFSKKLQTILLILIASGLLLQSKDFWHARAYQKNPEIFYSGIYYSTTDTGESAPIWSVRFMEHTPKAHLEVISGKAKIIEKERTSIHHQYAVSAQQKVQLLENTLYFPGWEIKVDNKPVTIQYQDPNNRGLMTFFVDKGTHTIDIHFTETRLRRTADSLSLVALVLLAGILFIPVRKSKQELV
jgi:hypothetical protein